MLFNLESPDFVNHRSLKVRAWMPGHILILQPWIVGSVKKSVDLIHHATEGMPANLSLHPLPIEFCHVSYLMTKITFAFSINDLRHNSIRSFHSFILPFPLATLRLSPFGLYHPAIHPFDPQEIMILIRCPADGEPLRWMII